LYYEALLFSQEGGLQQILLLHEEGDTQIKYQERFE
jgi:hypothetical protein